MRTPDTTRWYRRLAVVVCGALVLRWYAMFDAASCQSVAPRLEWCFWNDGFYYFSQGRLIGDGHFFKNGWIYESSGELVDSALHPPGFSILLGIWSALGLDSVAEQLMMLGIVGAATVVAVAVLARRLAGDSAGLVAAVLAAVYPQLWYSEVIFLSESLFQLVVALLLIAAYSYADSPGPGRIALVGSMIGLAALVRGEAALYGVFLLIPLVMLTPSENSRQTHSSRSEAPHIASRTRRGLRHVLIGGASALIVVSPWVIYINTVYDEPVGLTSAAGRVLMQGSCDSAWHGERQGYFGAGRLCFDDLDLTDEFEAEFPGLSAAAVWDYVNYDESLLDGFYRTQALDYIRSNLRHYPGVMLARVGRMFGVYQPLRTLGADWFGDGGPIPNGKLVMWIAYLALLVPNVRGALTLRRAGKRLTPLLGLWAAVLVTSALTFGITRYRAPVDVAMVVLGGIGLNSWRRGARSKTTEPDSPTIREEPRDPRDRPVVA